MHFLEQVFSQVLLSQVLSGTDFARLSSVCTYLNNFCEKEDFWRLLCTWKWPSTTDLAGQGLIAIGGKETTYRKYYTRRIDQGKQIVFPSKTPTSRKQMSLIIDIAFQGGLLSCTCINMNMPLIRSMLSAHTCRVVFQFFSVYLQESQFCTK